jgi:hypothetical protein
MSFDIYVQGFAGGDAAPLDAESLGELIHAHAVRNGDEIVRLSFDDGEAEFYCARGLGSGFMVNHASGRLVWDFLAEIIVRCGATVLPIGAPPMVGSVVAIRELPEVLAENAVVVTTGAEMLAVFLAP